MAPLTNNEDCNKQFYHNEIAWCDTHNRGFDYCQAEVDTHRSGVIKTAFERLMEIVVGEIVRITIEPDVNDAINWIAYATIKENGFQKTFQYGIFFNFDGFMEADGF